MAGNSYSFSIPPSMFSGIFTAYFIPTLTDSQINITTITRNGLERINRTSHFYRGSIIYAYNGSTSGPSTVYVSGGSPFLILLSMRANLKQIPYESFACTMLMPLPDEAYSQIALEDDFDNHFAPLDPSKDYRTQLSLAAPMENCQSFTVLTFRPNSTQLIDVKPNVISDNVTMEWNHRVNDAILYDVPRQSDTFLLDGKAVEAEYVQRFENPFRYITMRKINTKKLERGLHCLQSKGRYLLFIFGGHKKMYGYVPAFNAYPMRMPKWTIENNSRSYRHDIFGVSFITLFPWITTDDVGDNSITTLTLDILNPHPYLVAEVNISYCSEAKGNLIEKAYKIAPYTHRKLEMSEKMMTKLHATYSDSIYRSDHDSRITIKSSMPISVTQSCFFWNEIGDSFAVLPLRMAGQRYSLSLPKSVANNSHVIIYFLPSNQTTKISITAKFDGKERFHEIDAKIERNSPIFAYYGSAKELSLNLIGDNPFQMIIAIQRMLSANVTSRIKGRKDFECAVAIPTMQNSTTHPDISNRKSTSNFIVDNFHPNHRICNIIFNYLGDFSTFSQLFFVAQYVTGRSHFAIHHYRNLIIVFMDKNAVNDLEIDGVFAADDVHELRTPYDCTYFTFKFFLPTVPVHYIQSSGRYTVHIRSDMLQKSFYQYFVAFGRYVSMREAIPLIEVINQKSPTERTEVVKMRNWEISGKRKGLESSPEQLFTTNETSDGMISLFIQGKFI
uniref:IgGFc_binding domain-containing protein n=1 Tax=Elaeophora elaphi TaxID=1147741 RepID=A0A0R3RTP2_9BILA